MGPAALYLDLLERCLINWIYPEAELRPVSPEGLLRPEGIRRLAEHQIRLVLPSSFDPRQRLEGGDRPPFAHATIGRQRLEHLRRCLEDILSHGVPGDLLDMGAGRGGEAIFMRGVLKANEVTERRVWVAGPLTAPTRPNPAEHDRGQQSGPALAVPLEQVRANFERYGLFDQQVCLLAGRPEDALPSAPIDRLALLRFSHLREMTHEALARFYPKLSPGGYLIADDYLEVPACRQAVDAFRREHRIDEPLLAIDRTAVCWKRSGGPAQGQAAPLDPALDWLRRGDGQRAAGQWSEAAASYRRALQLRPDLAEAASHLGLVLHEQGRLEEAASAYELAVRLQPGVAEVHVRIGNLMQDLERPDEAVASYRQALALRPDAFAHANLGQLLANQGKMEGAARHFDASMRMRPNPKARLVRETLLPPVYDSLDDLTGWRQRLVDGVARLNADGARIDTTGEVVPALFFLAYQGQNERQLQRDYSRLFLPGPEALPRPSREGKVRVGLLSKHFCNHTIGSLNRGVVARLPREHLHVTVLSAGIANDQTALAFQEHADHYVALPQHLGTARRMIADLGLDVLYHADIGMAPFTHTLAYSRLAPIQCVTWGHPLTTGIPTIDYFVSSELAEPADAEGHYTEKLVRLKGLQTYYLRPRPEGPPKGRDHFGLPADANLYGCPQTLFKFHPDFDAILAGVLRADPRGLLVMIEGRHPHWNEMLLTRWRRIMPDVLPRVRFLPKLSRDDFLHLTALLDVSLDPLHFGGGNTTLEALALGTPVVTLPAPYLRGRLTLAQYRLMGMTDCVVATAEEYIALAVRLGSDRGERRAISERVLETCPVLYENALGVNALAEFFLSVVKR